MPITGRSTPSPVLDATTQITGMNRIVPMAFRGQDLNPLWETMMARVTANPADAAAMMDLATTLQSLGRSEDARQVMEGALSLQRDFCVRHGDGSGLRLLAFVTAGDFMANTPLDFLLDGSNCVMSTPRQHRSMACRSMTSLSWRWEKAMRMVRCWRALTTCWRTGRIPL